MTTSGSILINPRATAAGTVASRVACWFGGSFFDVFELLLEGEDHALHGIYLLVQLNHKLI